ncbi:hypothetical protein ETB97_012913, partial [Aspergillus alliaceus]
LGEVEHHVRHSFRGAEDVVAEVVVPTSEKQSPALIAFVQCEQLGQNSHTLIDTDNMSIFLAPGDWFWSAALAADAQLHESLPNYMVPAVFLPVHHIPLTVTGKANRRWLREQAASLSRQQLEAYTHPAVAKRQPTTKSEKALQQLWAQVLNMELAQIGVDDSFFWLGGDSISAMQLSAKCRSEGFPITVSQIFHHKTLARLALCAADHNSATIYAEEQFEVPFSLSPIQQMFFENEPRGHNHFNQSFFLQITREVASADIARAVESIVTQHSMLRARFRHTDDGRWTQLIKSTVNGSYRYQEHEVASVQDATPAMNTSQTSLDIQDGPLFAVDLINTCEEGQYIFLVAHHLVIDLVSWRIILDDLEEILRT